MVPLMCAGQFPLCRSGPTCEVELLQPPELIFISPTLHRTQSQLVIGRVGEWGTPKYTGAAVMEKKKEFLIIIDFQWNISGHDLLKQTGGGGGERTLFRLRKFRVRLARVQPGQARTTEGVALKFLSG